MVSPKLFDSINSTNGFPKASDTKLSQQVLDRILRKYKNSPIHKEFETIIRNPVGGILLHGIAEYSPHLVQLVIQHGEFFVALCSNGVDATYEDIRKSFSSYDPLHKSQAEVMHDLRIYKGKLSLLTAIADICGLWKLEKLTGALSDFADNSLGICCRFLLRQGHDRGEILSPCPETPERNSGIILLALGKMGGGELNYSSDIDIMFLYDPDKVKYTGRHTVQHFMSRMAQSILTMMQERSVDGYVFRTDLRLRPDPSSTPPAIATTAALTYYESVGQNWERAALIKARPAAGDIKAGEEFIAAIEPFIWRKHLDFASIADIQSIKRQMTAQHDRPITLPGHNIKTGRGGIREIEFLAQIYQLIWGGRIPALRKRSTCRTLQELAAAEIINTEQQQQLTQSYHFLRNVEHRLQMMRDQQTHSIPESPEERANLAHFLGYGEPVEFEEELHTHLQRVHDIYKSSFAKEGSLGDSGNLSFTGVDFDPDTLDTLRDMGFSTPQTVAALIQSWHHGKRRATRTKRARELITELTPEILRRFSATANPDQAFIRFDEFMQKLPAGVQIFSLFASHPNLLELIAIIMGSAPAMAERLARSPDLLDIVLTADFYSTIEDEGNLQSLIELARSPEEKISLLGRYKNEQSFLIGIKLIRRQITYEEASIALSLLAENILREIQKITENEFIKTYGVIPGGSLAIVALGRLGVKELTFDSDLDLLFVYDAPDLHVQSSGKRSFASGVYYNRLSQRIIGAVTALGRGGRLYEIDTRLRPGGADGLLAISAAGFDHYFAESAWTFEFMALTKARVISGDEKLQNRLQHSIRHHITQPRDAVKLAADVDDMRSKVAAEFPADNPWNIKYIRGGVMDLEFIAQYFILLHAHKYPQLLQRGCAGVFRLLGELSLIDAVQSKELAQAADFLNAALAVTRLCGNVDLAATKVATGTKILLAQLLEEEDFSSLQRKLLQTEEIVKKHYGNIIASGGG